jgi:protein O-mannosyl-transferase
MKQRSGQRGLPAQTSATTETALRVRLIGFAAHRGVLPLAVAAVTAAAFSGSLGNDFVPWDDPVLILDNEAYRGLGWPQVSWMFSNVMMGHYVPVTWLTLGLDYVLWGMDPAGYHLTNLALHAAGAALFYLVALRLLAAATRFSPPILRLAAAFASLFFAVHPLRVESVAWVTERRDVLSGLFFFATLLLYLRAVACDAAGRRRGYWACHALAWLAYLLAIFSKSIVMTLPAILLLLDVYPLRRLDGNWRAWGRAPAWLVWREKVPYAALGVLAAMLGYYAQAANGFFTSADVVPWTARPSLVLYSLWFYVDKTLVPRGLAPLYELPARIDPLSARFFLPAAGVLLITALLLALRRRWPAGLAVWLSYAILLAPVAGLTHSGYQLAHDRYSYLSCLGFALLLGAGAGVAASAVARGLVRPVLAGAALATLGAWLLGLGVLTWQQVETWRDGDMLWRHAAESQPDCAVCRYNVAALAFNAGLPSLARDELQRLLQVRPDRVQVYAHLGLAHAAAGDAGEAIAAYRRVLARMPDDPNTRNNLALALESLGRYREALAELEHAVSLAPDHALTRANLGIVQIASGDVERGMANLSRALAIDSTLGRARLELVLALLRLGRPDAARVQHELLGQVDPARAALAAPAFLTTW